MKNIDIFKTSDFILNNPLYTLLLVTLFYLIYLREFKFIILYKLKYYIRFLLFVVAISNPINELYECVFQQDKSIYVPKNEIDDNHQKNLKISNKNRSHVFGIIERLAIGFLILFNAFETIGFILAAKALVREKLIKEDDEFAQMYYIGTLYSLVSVFVLWAVCFW